MSRIAQFRSDCFIGIQHLIAAGVRAHTSLGDTHRVAVVSNNLFRSSSLVLVLKQVEMQTLNANQVFSFILALPVDYDFDVCEPIAALFHQRGM